MVIMKKIIHYIGCNDCNEDDAKKWKKYTVHAVCNECNDGE